MRRFFLLGLLLPALSGFSFDERPWISEPYLFEFRPSFAISHFSQVANATPKDFSSWNENLNLNLGVSTLSNMDIQAEMNFFQSRMRSFNFESVAFQVRKLLLDDIIGDICSLIMGLNYRIVPHSRLKDIAMPYHFVSNFEAVASFGKEFPKGPYWLWHFYMFAAAGIANKGSAWVKVNPYLQAMIANRHELSSSLTSYFGFGPSKNIQINRFDGYYDTKHQNVDIQGEYRYHFPIYGSLGVSGAYRLYARAYPKKEYIVKVDYRYPFSVF